MGQSIYMRNVPYSGKVPDAGEARWALVRSTEMLSNQISRAAGGLDRLGRKMQEDEEREGRINAVRGRAALDEYTRQFLYDAPKKSWVDDHGLSRHGTMEKAWEEGSDGSEGYARMKEALASRLPRRMQAEWLADIESQHEPRWREAVVEKSRELREAYATSVTTSAVRTPGMAGDITSAEEAMGNVQSLFAPEEWDELSGQANTEAALGMARYDEGTAREYARKYVPKERLGQVEEAIDKVAKAARLEQERAANDAREEINRKSQMQMIAYELGKGPAPTVADTYYKMENGLMDLSVGEHILDGLTKKRQINPQTHATAYMALERMASLVQAGKISRVKWYAALKAHGLEVTAEEEAMFVSRANAERARDPESPLRNDAETLATDTMKRLYPAPRAGDKKTESAETLKIDAAVTRIMQELTAFAEQQRAQGKPLDATAYRTKANEIVDRVYREEYKAKYPDKGPGFFSRVIESQRPKVDLEPEEPRDQAEFERTVRTMKDDAAAQEYYDRYKGKF